MAERLLQELLEFEFTECLGAEGYECAGRPGCYRNGYRERPGVPLVDWLTLRVAKD